MSQRPASRPYSTEEIAAIRRAVVALAGAAHVDHPQYDGHWDGPEWFVVRLTRTVKTKLGVAFEAGEITLAKHSRMDPRDLAIVGPRPLFVTAYSIRNKIDTSVQAAHVEQLG